MEDQLRLGLFFECPRQVIPAHAIFLLPRYWETWVMLKVILTDRQYQNRATLKPFQTKPVFNSET